MSDYDIAQRQALSFPVTPPSLGSATQAQRAADESTGVSCRLGDSSCASAHAARVSRSALRDGSMLHRSLRHLQREFGNQYVGQVIHRATGERASSAEDSTDAIERSIDGARGGGQGMDHGTRSRMESSFGADFSGVRIHHDSRADGLSQALSARAFTTGRDVFFRQGEYSPGTSSGRELLAHELTHVVQQNGDGVQRKMTVSQPGDPHEVEADQMARAVTGQEHAVQRQPEAPLSEDEEKKKVHTKADATRLMRDEDEQKQE